MARTKETITQRDFSLGVIRPEFLEGDDLDMRQQSLRDGRNLRVLSTRSLQARPGTFFVRRAEGVRDAIEVQDTSGNTFGLLIGNGFLAVIDRAGNVVQEIESVPWSGDCDLWAAPFRDETIIGTKCGTQGLWILRGGRNGWEIQTFAFEGRPGGEIAQPYWVHERGVTILPSGREGSITVTASAPIFTPAHVGTRIRYARREIEITSRLTASSVTGTVIRTLPPTWRIRVKNIREFAVGEAVVGSETNFQGVISHIEHLGGDDDIGRMWVVTLQFFDGPDEGEDLSGPKGSSEILRVRENEPVETNVWDEPLMSAARGWPRSGSSAGGRLFLVDHPSAPSAIAVSSARGARDFFVGAADDDAIAREAGDGNPRFLHVVGASDIILLSDRGCYYLQIREGGVLTPRNFNPILFDKRGASPIAPVQVEDGVVFVEASGQTIAAALLDGNVYLIWSVVSLTVMHNHLIDKPVRLCGPSLDSSMPEKYMFVVNSDGTLAVVSWGVSIREETAGFIPWDTDGDFITISPLFGKYWAVVDRTEGRHLERFDEDAYLDAVVLSSDGASLSQLEVNGDPFLVNGQPLTISAGTDAFAGMTLQGYKDGWFIPEVEIDENGAPLGITGMGPDVQIGRNFEAVVSPWPIKLIQSPRSGMVRARTIRMVVSVQDTLGFTARTNNTSVEVGRYSFGDDLSAPPQPVTDSFRFSVFGIRQHPDLAIIKDKPGPFRVLAIGQEVQA